MPAPVIARGAVLLAREKRATQAIQAEREARKIAQTHNIKNAEARYSEHATARLLQEQLRQKMHQRRKTRRKAFGNMAQASVAESRFAQSGQTGELRTAVTVNEQPRITRASKARGGLKMLSGLGLAAHFQILGWSALLQFVFALVSAAAFSVHAGIASFGGVFSTVAGVLPFELVGYGCWGIVMIITVALFFGYLAYFSWQRTPIFDDTISLASCAVCVGLNFFIITNIFPWLQLWILYWLARGVGSPLSSGTHSSAEGA